MLDRQKRIRRSEQAVNLSIINPRHEWVKGELDKLLAEWTEWQKIVEKIEDQPYDKDRQSEVFADGKDMMQRHEILQIKTLTFLNNNIEGHGFISGFDGNACDRTDLRLKFRVEHRLHQLRMVSASLEYAILPESFWKEQARKLIETVREKGAEGAMDAVTSWLKNPLVK